MEREWRDPRELDRHPVNESVYGDETLPEDFIESIRDHGVRNPVVVTSDDTVVSGHRRVAAAREVGETSIPVQIEELSSDLEIREAIIHYNKQRTKTFSQKMREALELEEIERKRAKERQGTRTDLVDENSDISQKFARSEIDDTGSTREKVAGHIDVSSETYRKAKAVWEAAQDGVSRFEREVRKIDKGDQSIHGAHKKLKRWEDLQELDDAIDWRTAEKAGTIDAIEKRERIFEDVEDNLNGDDTWVESLRTLRERYSDDYRVSGQDDTYVFAYLIESRGPVSFSDEDSGVSSVSQRKPDAETLESEYWGKEGQDLDLQELAVKYGVDQALVKYWLREEDIFLKREEFSEAELNQIERAK